MPLRQLQLPSTSSPLAPHQPLSFRPSACSTLVAPHPLHSLIRDLIINKKIVIAGSRAVMHKRRISPYVRVPSFSYAISLFCFSYFLDLVPTRRCMVVFFLCIPFGCPKTPLAPHHGSLTPSPRGPPLPSLSSLISEKRPLRVVTHARFQGKLDCHYEGVLIRKVLMFAF